MMMDLEIRHLRLVSAVADVGSLTRAGDQLHLTQSALSHQLRNIESRLGAALFFRGGKGLGLTPPGARVVGSPPRLAGGVGRAGGQSRPMGGDPAPLAAPSP